MNASKKQIDCHFNMLGQCTKGDSCEFRHYKGNYSSPVCSAWLKEECDDPNCLLRHPTLPRRPDGGRILCNYDKTCTKREACPFLHSDMISDLPAATDSAEAAPNGQNAKSASKRPQPQREKRARPKRQKASLKPAGRAPAVSPLTTAQEEKPKAKFVKSFEQIMKEKEEDEQGTQQSEAPAAAKKKRKPKASESLKKQKKRQKGAPKAAPTTEAKAEENKDDPKPVGKRPKRSQAKQTRQQQEEETPAPRGQAETASDEPEAHDEEEEMNDLGELLE